VIYLRFFPILPLLVACGTVTAPAPAQLTTPVPINFCKARTTPHGDLPDLACTPGATNPAVTPATISTTICKSGWTATVRPPSSYTSPLERAQIVRYRYADTDATHYEEDHLVPLEVGGAPRDPLNLWPESYASAHQKDQVENAAHAAICAGKLPLATAQAGFQSDWTVLGQQLGVSYKLIVVEAAEPRQ